MILENKVALVTGSGRGIGEAISTTLASEGADIIVNDYDTESAQRVARRIEKLGRKTMVYPADVTDRRQLEKMFGKSGCRLYHRSNHCLQWRYVYAMS